MSNSFTAARPRMCRSVLAAHLVTTTLALAYGATAAPAADMAMAMKAPPAPVYSWSGCYAGLNIGEGTSASNFGSVVGTGTYLAAGDAATVAGSGGGSKNADGVLPGGQIGCNFQSGLFVAGIEGDFDYFRSNPVFNNNTNTLANGNGFCHLAIADDQLSGDGASAYRHRRGP